MSDIDLNPPTAPLFDERGRRIPFGLASNVHPKVRDYFGCNQPKINYQAVHHRLAARLGGGDALSAVEFERRAEALLERLGKDEKTGAVVNAVRAPFFIPQIPEASREDVGAALEERWLPAVKSAYHDHFPDYQFVNHHSHGLAGCLSVAPDSRHGRLLEAVERGVVVGWVFISLSAYSIPAAIEQTASLEPAFMLSGGFDICAALVGSPELLYKKSGYPPLLWLAALTGEKSGIGYHFEAYGYNLTFNRRPHLDEAAEYWASALTVID